MGERISQVEETQERLQLGVQGLDRSLAQADVVSRSLSESSGAIRQGLAAAQEGLAVIQSQARARQDLETQNHASIRRLETIIAGTQSKGAAGENILEATLAQLPPEWQVRDFRVAGKVVEFGLRLPSGLVLPIDSKWPATDLLERYAQVEDQAEGQRLRRQIEQAMIVKAREVRKYLDPALTVEFAVAAVPDAVYDLCGGLHAGLYQMNVALVSYSLLLPYILLVFHTSLKESTQVDLARVTRYLDSAQLAASAMQTELDGRFSNALAMLTNSRAELSAQVSQLSSGLTGMRTRPTFASPSASAADEPASPQPDEALLP